MAVKVKKHSEIVKITETTYTCSDGTEFFDDGYNSSNADILSNYYEMCLNMQKIFGKDACEKNYDFLNYCNYYVIKSFRDYDFRFASGHTYHGTIKTKYDEQCLKELIFEAEYTLLRLAKEKKFKKPYSFYMKIYKKAYDSQPQVNFYLEDSNTPIPWKNDEKKI